MQITLSDPSLLSHLRSGKHERYKKLRLSVGRGVSIFQSIM